MYIYTYVISESTRELPVKPGLGRPRSQIKEEYTEISPVSYVTFLFKVLACM